MLHSSQQREIWVCLSIPDWHKQMGGRSQQAVKRKWFIDYYLYIVLHIPLMLQSFLDADQDRKNIFASLGGPAEPWEGLGQGQTLQTPLWTWI